jgi:hypothetical protein
MGNMAGWLTAPGWEDKRSKLLDATGGFRTEVKAMVHAVIVNSIVNPRARARAGAIDPRARARARARVGGGAWDESLSVHRLLRART